MMWLLVYLTVGVFLAGAAAVAIFPMGIRPGVFEGVSDRKLMIMLMLTPMAYGPLVIMIVVQNAMERSRIWMRDWMRDGKPMPIEHPTAKELRECYGSMTHEDRSDYRRNAELAIKIIDEIDSERAA